MEGVQILDSLSKKTVPLETKNNSLNIYICGPTVYAPPHLGHARTYLIFDIINRILQDYFNLNTTVTMNITDVDDKIIASTLEKYYFEKFSEQINSHKEISIVELIDQFYKTKIKQLEEKLKSQNSLISSEQNSKVKKELEEELLTIEFQLKNTSENHSKFSQSLSNSPTNSKLLSQNKSIIGIHLKDLKQSSNPSNLPPLISEILKTSPSKQDYTKFARFFEIDFFSTLSSLNIQKPQILTRCTEFILQMISFVETLLKSNLAYIHADRSVYFNLEKYKETHFKYGQLTKIDVSNPLKDFALWKFVEHGEPAWEAPFGRGRPGWHLECSTMSTSIYGKYLDLHCGGVDLKFPHHENEIAQCNAFNYSSLQKNAKNWCTHFIHTGHLNIKGHKMSKSLKNFITIKDLIKEINHTEYSNIIRILFVNAGEYYKPMNYEESIITQSKEIYRSIKEFINKVEGISLKKLYLNNKINKLTNIEMEIVEERFGDRERKILKFLNESKRKIDKFLRNNFGIKNALNELIKLIENGNKYLGVNDLSKINITLLESYSKFIKRILTIFGIDIKNIKNGKIEAINSLLKKFESREIIRKLFKKKIGTGEFKERMGEFLKEFEMDEYERELKNDLVKFENGEIKIEEILKKSDFLREETKKKYGVNVEDLGEYVVVVPGE